MNKILIKNLFWNSSSQFLNLLIPIISLPIIIPRIGLESYGEMVIHLLAWQSICVVIDYNYNSVGVSMVLAEKTSNRGSVNFILFVSKIYLFVFGVFVLWILRVFYFGNDTNLLFFLGFVYILGHLLTNHMWFSVNDKFYLLAGIALISKVFFIVNIYIFAYSLFDILLIQSFSLLISGILSLYITRYLSEFDKSPNVIRHSIDFLYKTFAAFLANFSGFILSSVPLYLGPVLLDATNFGIYAFLDRLVRVFLAIYSAINQVVFRRTLSIALNGFLPLRHHINLLLRKIVPLYVTLCLAGSVVAISISDKLFDVNIENYKLQFLLLIAWSVLSVVSSIIGFHYLQGLGRYRQYGSIMLISLISTIALVYIFGFNYGIEGIVSGMIVSELIVLIILTRLFSVGV